MPVRVEIDNTSYTIPTDVFRRIITLAAFHFEKTKKDEGSMWPTIDKKALSTIRDLQFKHRELI